MATKRNRSRNRCWVQHMNRPAIVRSSACPSSMPDVPLVQAAQNVVPVAVTAGDKIEALLQWALGTVPQCRPAGYLFTGVWVGRKSRIRRVMREPG